MRRVPAILIVIFPAFPLLFVALVTIGVSTWALGLLAWSWSMTREERKGASE